MGFPDNVLARDEKVVRDLHPHWLTVFGPTLVGLILLGAAIFVAWVTPDDTTGNWIQWIVVAVTVLIAVPLVVVPYLRWRTTRYVVTSHRVMVRRGILSKAGKDITLSKITDVSFEQTLLDRMIRAGTLSIESAGDSPDESLRNIPHSDNVQQLINHLIDEDANKRAERLYGGRGGDSGRGADSAPGSADPVHTAPTPTPEGAPRTRPEGSPRTPPEGSPATPSATQSGTAPEAGTGAGPMPRLPEEE